MQEIQTALLFVWERAVLNSSSVLAAYRFFTLSGASEKMRRLYALKRIVLVGKGEGEA